MPATAPGKGWGGSSGICTHLESELKWNCFGILRYLLAEKLRKQKSDARDKDAAQRQAAAELTTSVFAAVFAGARARDAAAEDKARASMAPVFKLNADSFRKFEAVAKARKRAQMRA